MKRTIPGILVVSGVLGALAGAVLLAVAFFESNSTSQTTPTGGTTSPTRAPLTATEAEAIAVRTVEENDRLTPDPQDAAFCSARERAENAWLVVCGVDTLFCPGRPQRDQSNCVPRRLEQIVTYSISDSGRVEVR